MKYKYLLALFVLTIMSCSKDNYAGFRIEIKCLNVSEEDYTVVFYDTMFSAINWNKQIYYLKDSIDHNLLNNKICYGGCLITSYINDKKCYDAIIECAVSSNNLVSSYSPNTIWFQTNEKMNYLFKKDRFELFPYGEHSKFLFNNQIKEYLIGQNLLVNLQ
ncbi:MAG: hypothetical protein ACPGSD_11565 [Flavobacteriales bacterium]